MTVLALLADGSCTQTGTCLSAPTKVHPTCPQAFKCGTCVAWSPREENGYGRNSGECMLNRDAAVYLDCNAQICPYYRPRDDNPAAQQALVARRTGSRGQGGRKRRRRLERQAPPPSPAALAMAAFSEHPAAIAEVGARVLEAQLSDKAPMPVLLERFRGGSVSVQTEGETVQVPLEAFFARLCLLRRGLDALGDAVARAPLGAAERQKIDKDLAGMGGAMTTFNVLFQDKADQFRGSGRS